MKRILALTLIVLMTIMGTSVSADSKSTDFVDANEKELLESFNELGIDSKTQEKLLEKLKNGELLDSMKQENIDKALESAQSLQMNESKIITFPDGSKAKFGSEVIKYEGDSGDSVGDVELNFKSRSPGNYTIKTYWTSIVVNAEYYTDATIVKGSNNDYITKVYDGSYSIIGGKVESETVSILQRNETSSYYAHSRYRIKYTLAGDFGSATFVLGTFVGNNGYDTHLGTESNRK